MNSRHRNIIAGHTADRVRIIAGGNDALVFIRRANEQARELNVGPAF